MIEVAIAAVAGGACGILFVVVGLSIVNRTSLRRMTPSHEELTRMADECNPPQSVVDSEEQKPW